MKEQVGGGFVVAGASGRVRNDDPAAIAALWDRFRAGDWAARLGHMASRDVYCVYHDYEGGFADPYQMTIGYRISMTSRNPDGVHRVEVPEQVVAVFRAEGPQPQTLIEQWQAIWAGDLSRTYRADYDIYDADRPEHVGVHVGVAVA